MLVALVIIITIVCFLLVLVVLAQNSKGGGVSSQFGGSATSQIMGVKKTGDFLEKFTWGLAITLLVLALSTTFFIDKKSNNPDMINSPNIDKAQERAILPGSDLGSGTSVDGENTGTDNSSENGTTESNQDASEGTTENQE